MTVPKIVGIEQEYAITLKGGEPLSPFQASCFLVNAYARELGLRDPGIRILWDYGHETPFRDIRGELYRKSGGQEIVGDDENLRINVALPNGARFYTDHAHPEYSTPECMSARDVTAWDKAGECILNAAAKAATDALPGTHFTLLKNNVDHQGHSYGCHENYLMDAQAHEEIFVEKPHTAVQTLIPFLVTRQLFAGAGKVGGESPETDRAFYQLSQRSDYMETIFGLETMYARAIVNTRQEHHADERRFRRLHLILGDANMCDCAGALKIGSTQIVLQMMEDCFTLENLSLKDPIRALRQVSADFTSRLDMADGRMLSPLDIQRKYLDRAGAFLQREAAAQVPEADWIIGTWAAVLDGLARLKLSPDMSIDDDPAGLTGNLDWVTKLWLLNRYRVAQGGQWHHPNISVLDLQYHNISPEHGIFGQLQRDGIAMRLLDDERISRCVQHPPPDTRAHFRGRCIEKFPREVYVVNWEVVGFDHGEVNRLVPLLNPLSGSREQVGELVDRCGDSRELVRMIHEVAGDR